MYPSDHIKKCDAANKVDLSCFTIMPATEDSQKGVTGLQNIGLTCYMNSAL